MSKAKKQKTPVYKKIEFDENTNEPIVVEVSADSLEAQAVFNEQVEKAGKIQAKADKKGGPIKHMVTSSFLDDSEEKAISKRQKVFKTIMSVLFVVFVVGVLAFTFYNDFLADHSEPFDKQAFFDTTQHSWYFILFAIASLFCCFLFKGIKLSIMSKQLTKKWRFGVCMRTGIVGHYYNSVTPLAVGGQPFEIYHLSKHGVDGGTATALPVATYFLNQFGYGLLGIVSIIMVSTNTLGIRDNFSSIVVSNVVTGIAIVGVCFCMLMPLLIVLFLMFPRFCAKIVHFVMFIGGKLKIVKKPKETTYSVLKTIVLNTRCLKKIATNPLTIISTFLLSILEAAASCSIAFFTLKFFGFALQGEINFMVEWIQTIFICMVLYNAISFIPTPGNSGAADLSFYALFHSNLAAGLAFPAMIIWRILSYYMFLVVGFTYNLIDKRSLSKHAQTSNAGESVAVTDCEEVAPAQDSSNNQTE